MKTKQTNNYEFADLRLKMCQGGSLGFLYNA